MNHPETDAAAGLSSAQLPDPRLLDTIESTLRFDCLIPRRAIIVVGVSGGADSLCLMDALHRMDCQITVAHFDHGLRPEAHNEVKQVEEAAALLGVPFVSGGEDVRAAAAVERRSLEEAARRLRYAFLFATARKIGAQAVAVGHTADDQVETVLMHFIRGAGLRGLRGMSYRTILRAFDPSLPVVRPLLDVWRDETVAYAAANGLTPIHDPSNESFEFFRNRLRHELIPTLRLHNPRFRETILRSAQALSSDYELLEERISSEWEAASLRQTDEYVALDATRLQTYSRGLQRHLIRRAAERLNPEAETSYEALDRAADFVADSSRLHGHLTGGLSLFREGRTLYVSRTTHDLPFDAWPQMPANSSVIGLSLPGRVELAQGWHFEAEIPVPADAAPKLPGRTHDPFHVWLDADSLPRQIELRARRRGDRFRPLGLEGHSQKLSDFLVNSKLPSRARARWPLVCAGETVIWVPGFRPGELFGLREASRRAVHFSVLQLA